MSGANVDQLDRTFCS